MARNFGIMITHLLYEYLPNYGLFLLIEEFNNQKDNIEDQESIILRTNARSGVNW
jgi:hypothetical protein